LDLITLFLVITPPPHNLGGRGKCPKYRGIQNNTSASLTFEQLALFKIVTADTQDSLLIVGYY
jgi:hypothetical protein